MKSFNWKALIVIEHDDFWHFNKSGDWWKDRLAEKNKNIAGRFKSLMKIMIFSAPESVLLKKNISSYPAIITVETIIFSYYSNIKLFSCSQRRAEQTIKPNLIIGWRGGYLHMDTEVHRRDNLYSSLHAPTPVISSCKDKHVRSV